MLADGFEEMEAVVVADVLRRAGVELLLVSVTGREEVTGAHGIGVMADLLFEKADFSEVEMVVLPGGMPGAAHLQAHEGVRNLVAGVHSRGRMVAAICAAPMVLGSLGLLEKKQATCYPGFEKYLQGALLSKEAVVADGLLVTGNGPGSALFFALRLAEKLQGKEVARGVADKMMVTGW